MQLKLWFESALRTVGACEAPEEGLQTLDLHTARNAYVSYQLLLRADCDLRVTDVSFGCAREGVALRGQWVEQVAFDSGTYFDPLSSEAECDLPAGRTRSLWITAFVPKDAPVGAADCRVLIDTDQGRHERLFQLSIHAAALPDPSEAAFSMEYWVNTVNFWFRYPSAYQLDFFSHH